MKKFLVIVSFMVAFLGFGAPAFASVGSSPPVTNVTHTVSGTRMLNDRSCPWEYKWHVDPAAGYSEVEWTDNPCEFRIQDKSEFTGIYENHYWVYSGKVKSTYLWARASAKAATDSVDNAYRRINFGVNWYPWREYWKS